MPTNEKILEFINSICENVKHKSVHKSISDEMENHIFEAVEILKSDGMSEKQAIDKAIEQMGNPKLIGKELNKVHSPKRVIIKYILLTLLIMIIIVAVPTIRKMIIISNLNNKISAYVEKTKETSNYYTQQSIYTGTSLQKTEYYVKDNSIFNSISMLSQDSSVLIEQYYNGTTTNVYMQIDNEKKVRLNDNSEIFAYGVINYLHTNNLYELFLLSLSTSIQSENCNGKDCYSINAKVKSLFTDSLLFMGDGIKIYIEKQTGLPVRELVVNSLNSPFDEVKDYIYEFDTVTDETFEQPNINEYEMQ